MPTQHPLRSLDTLPNLFNKPVSEVHVPSLALVSEKYPRLADLD